VSLIGFENCIKNIDMYTFTCRSCWFVPIATGWAIRSVDNGTGCVVDDAYTLGGNGFYFSRTSGAVEGVTITNSEILATGGKGLRFDGCLKLLIANTVVGECNDTALLLDGTTGYPVADVNIVNSWFGTKASASAGTVGVDLRGNIADDDVHRM